MGRGGAKKLSSKVLAQAKKQAELDALRRQSAIKDEHYKDLEKVLRAVLPPNSQCLQPGGDPKTHRDTGLDNEDLVRYQQRQHGKNEIPRPKEKSIAVKIMEEQVGGFSLVMWMAAACHLYSGYYLADAEYRNAGITMIVMSILTALFLFFENYRAKPNHQPQYDVELECYKVRRHGKERKVLAKDIVVGDILVGLSHGKLVPADCRILSCDKHTNVNNTIFGAKDRHSTRVSEDDGGNLDAAENVMDAKNMLWRGTDIMDGVVQEALVVKVGRDTQAGRTLKLMHALEEKADHQSFSRTELGSAAMFFSGSALVVMFASLIYMNTGYEAPLDSTDMSIIAASVLLACIPMGLLLSTMLTLRTSYARMKHNGVFVKDLGHIEVMGGCSAIVTQPQGPLSNGHEAVAALVYYDHGEIAMTFPPSPYDKFKAVHEEVVEECSSFGAQALQKSVLLSCNDARFVDEEEDKDFNTRFDKNGALKHPFVFRIDEKSGRQYRHFQWGMVGEETDCAAVRLYQEMPADFQEIKCAVQHTTPDGKTHEKHEMTEFDAVDIREHYPRIFWSPFDAVRGFEIAIRTSGPGQDVTVNNSPRVVYIKGNPESVIKRCRFIRDPHEGMRPITEVDKRNLNHTVKRYSREGLKIVAYAESEPLPLAKYSHAYNYSDTGTGNYVTANFPLGEDEDEKDVHPRSVGGLIFNGMVCTYDETRDLSDAIEQCVSGGIRIVLTTTENADHGLALARKVGIVTEEHTDYDLIEHNEVIRNIVGTDAAIDPHDYKEENIRLQSLPQDLQDFVTRKMCERYEKGAEENIVKEGLDKFIDPDVSNATVIVADSVYDSKAKKYCDLEDMDTEWWETLLRNKPQIVIARCRPKHRQTLCLHLKRLDYTVALTGMGPEDALAVEEADIGICTPEGATMTQDAAHVILQGGHFAGIVELIKEGRLVYENLKKTTAFLTASNVPQMLAVFSNVWLELPLPINATLILLVDLITNMIPSIAMAGEPPESPLMHQPPRNIKTDRILTFKMIFFSYFQIGMIQAFAGLYAYFVVLTDYGFSPSHLYEGGPKGNWGNAPLYCKFDGGTYVNTRGEIDISRDPTTQRPDVLYPLWDAGDGGTVKECVHPIRNFQGGGKFSLHATPINIGLASSYYHHQGAHTTGRAMITVETLDALEYNGFYEYIPFQSRMSAFWRDDWLSYDITQTRESLSGNQIPYRSPEEEDEFRDRMIGKQDVLRYFQKASLGLWSICLEDPSMKPSNARPEALRENEEHALKGFGSLHPPDHPTDPGLFSQPTGARHSQSSHMLPIPTVNMSTLGSTGCRRSHQAEPGALYTNALFCNGDQYRVKKQQFFKRANGPDGATKSWMAEMFDWTMWKDGKPSTATSWSTSQEYLDDDVFVPFKYRCSETDRVDCLITSSVNGASRIDDEYDGFMPDSAEHNVTVNLLREKCALLDDHHHQLAYCRGKCDYECTRLKPHERFNITGEVTDVMEAKGVSKDGWEDSHTDDGLEVYGGKNSIRTCQCANIASRMVQKEALYNARTAFLVAIVFCQIATIIAFKTRWLSVIQHGLGNPLLNVGLFASVMAMALATYSPLLNSVFSTRPIRFYHWMPGLPWACMILVYDEVRKFFMRKTSSNVADPVTGERTRVIGWLEANTHY